MKITAARISKLPWSSTWTLVWPVSYTHLDVYKRQPLSTRWSGVSICYLYYWWRWPISAACYYWRLSLALYSYRCCHISLAPHWSPAWFLPSLRHSLSAVSYTHLDVYKRQVRTARGLGFDRLIFPTHQLCEPGMGLLHNRTFSRAVSYTHLIDRKVIPAIA